jgi:hypothetical protein
MVRTAPYSVQKGLLLLSREEKGLGITAIGIWLSQYVPQTAVETLI